MKKIDVDQGDLSTQQQRQEFVQNVYEAVGRIADLNWISAFGGENSDKLKGWVEDGIPKAMKALCSMGEALGKEENGRGGSEIRNRVDNAIAMLYGSFYDKEERVLKELNDDQKKYVRSLASSNAYAQR